MPKLSSIYKELLLSVTSHTNRIVGSWPDKRCLSHCMCLYQVIMTLHFLNDVVNDIESMRIPIITSIIIAILKSESTCKLINRIQRFASFNIKFTRLGFENARWIAQQASRCQQGFSKPHLVNLISKDTHLVFSISSAVQADRCILVHISFTLCGSYCIHYIPLG